MTGILEKRWLISSVQSDAAEEIAAGLQIPLLVAELLVQRGYDTVDKARRFLSADPFEDLYDPFLMKDMDKAVARIRQAIQNSEPIVVYGDYDVDGVTSTALLYLGLLELRANVRTYIPDRFEEGYGLNHGAIESLRNTCTLLITVDNGIAAIEQVAYAKELGFDVIVTDHHNPQERLPEADALLNPKQPGCQYPDKMLAGVGIAFKLVQALWERVPEELSDLAALGTVADLAPLVDENRLLVQMGLTCINRAMRPGLSALAAIAGLESKTITAGHIGFQLGPRMNASGRLDKALSALELLIETDPERCQSLAALLDAYNLERQELCEQMLEEAEQLLDREPKLREDPILVLGKEGWHTGVVGIVAARLVERYYRPVVLLSYLEDGSAKGSARSISGIDLYDALADSAHLYHHFGGHKMAAGLSLEQRDVPELRLRLKEWAVSHVEDEVWIPKVHVDRVIQSEDLTESTVRAIEKMGPFGFGNPSPTFALCQLVPLQVRTVGREQQHLQLHALQNGVSVQAIGFGRGAEQARVLSAGQIDIAGDLICSEWQGKVRVQMMLREWRPSQQQYQMIRQFTQKANWIESNCAGRKAAILAFSEKNLEAMKAALTQYPWQNSDHYQFLLVKEDGIQNSTETQAEFAFLIDFPDQMTEWRQLCQEIRLFPKFYVMLGNDDYLSACSRLERRLPGREAFAQVYRILQRETNPSMDHLLRQYEGTEEELSLMLQVFAELDLVERTEQGFRVRAVEGKRPLTDAPTYQRLHLEIKQLQQVYGALAELDGPAFIDWMSKQVG